MAKKKAAAEGGEKVTVQVSESIAKKGSLDKNGNWVGGAYHDPDHETNPQSIGKEPVEVVRTPFIEQRLRAGDLVEVRGGKAIESEK